MLVIKVKNYVAHFLAGITNNIAYQKIPKVVLFDNKSWYMLQRVSDFTMLDFRAMLIAYLAEQFFLV